MNIFYLHKDPVVAARAHIDKHVIKIPLEVAQMACTNSAAWALLPNICGRTLNSEELSILRDYANIQRDLEQDERYAPYLPTHPNHPCTIWMRTSKQNLEWAYAYAFALEREYTHRYGKPHLKACQALRDAPIPVLPDTGFTTPAMAMPDKYKCDDPVMSYRNYYLGEKRAIATWKNREPPAWWINTDFEKTN